MARKKPTGVVKKWSRPKYAPKRKVCTFCADKSARIDYKDPDKLRSFVSDRAKIVPRRRTGTCAKHQRVLAVAIKRARHLALLPYVPAHMRKVGTSMAAPVRVVAPPPPPEAAAAEEPTTAEESAATVEAE